MAISATPGNVMNFSEKQQACMILEKLWNQRETGRFCDVVLYAQGQKFRAHRSVLAACSPYFDSVLKTHKIIKEQLTVTCQNLEAFQLFLNFMYTGAIIIDKNNVSELLRLANHFLVLKLKNYCAEFLDRYLDPSNCVSTKELAENYNLPALFKNASAFILNNIVEVFEQKETLEFCPEKLEAFLKENNLLIPQHIALNFISKWVLRNIVDHEKYFKRMIDLLKWDTFEKQYIEDHINMCPLYQKNQKCLYILLTCLEEHKIKISTFNNTLGALKAKFGSMKDNISIDGIMRSLPKYPISLMSDENTPITVLPLEKEHYEEEDGFYSYLKDSSDDESSNSSFENIPPENLIEDLAIQNGEKLPPAGSQKLRSKSYSRRLKKHRRFARSKTALKISSGSPYGITENSAAGPSNKHSISDVESDAENIENDDSSSATYSSAEDSTLDLETSLKWKDGVKCPNCSFIAHSSGRLEQHVSRIHSKDVTYKCKICEFTCKWNRDYYIHMKSHFEGPPFKCESCDYKCESIQSLLTHRMTHAEEKLFKCEECNHRCRTRVEFDAHLRNHVGERLFQCELCEQSFTVKAALDEHLTTHSDDRPYLCDICGFSTKYQSHLISHKKTHTGDVFHCHFPNCSYSTPKKSQLGSHQRTHTAVRSHVCSICGRAFIEKSHLVRHERIHLNDKPFKCEHCDYSSSRRDKLKEHFRKHHGENATAKGPYRPRKQRRQGYEVGNYAIKRPPVDPENSQPRHRKNPPSVPVPGAGFPGSSVMHGFDPSHRDILQNHAAMALQQLGVVAHNYQAAFLDPHLGPNPQSVMSEQNRINLLAAATNAVGQPPDFAPFMPFM